MTSLWGNSLFTDELAALTHWDLPPILSVEVMEEGHRVFKITTAGAAFALKDVTDGFNLERLAFTTQVLEHVARSGFKVPVPVISQRGQIAVHAASRIYFLSEFIEAGRSPTSSASSCYEAGRALALLHQALATYPDTDFVHKTWREDLVGNVDVWFSTLCNGLPDEQASPLWRVRQSHQDAIKATLHGLPEQLIHRDCHPGNLIVDGTRVLGFIDWDDLCVGPRLFDPAYYAAHLLKRNMGDDIAIRRWLAHLPSLLKGYHHQSLLTPNEVLAFPYLMMAYHLLLAHWHMTLDRPANLARELHALTWIHNHFAALFTTIEP
ncbi:phosphotransferase [bacterium]|nr:phosphotransferase [bacterium]